MEALQWSKKYVEISDQDIEIIIAARRAMLYLNGEPWAKKGGEIFDVGMGFFDGAEISEIVGLFLLEEIRTELGINIGIYRDDGCGVTDLPPQDAENLKKQIGAIFRRHKLEITSKANKKRVEFLDIYMDLDLDEYGPYIKENNAPLYVDAGSNHPSKVLENIPKGINRRLSQISATNSIFEKAAPKYQDALEKSGHKYRLNFDPSPPLQSEAKKQGRQRKRAVIWFNPPFSREVTTNVGQLFLQIMDKHFPPGNPLNQIFNRNKVKMSYRCTANLARTINSHNSKILSPPKEDNPKECNCRKNTVCPVQGKCLQEGVVYQATVKREDGITDTYIGLTATSFKVRWTNHKSNFRTRNPKNKTALSKHIWKLQDQNVQYEISWKIVSRARPFNHVTGVCNLCIREKYFIIFKPEMASLNLRDEIAGPCLHKQKELLKKS